MSHRFIDISWPLHGETVSYKNRHPIVVEVLRTMAEQGIADSRCGSLHMHAGTHIDAPSHCIEGGKSIEQLPLEAMNGMCRVLDLTSVGGDRIEADDLKQFAIQPGERILLKTINSSMPAEGTYRSDEVYVAASAAQYLARCGIALIGVDALGLERNQPAYDSHRAFFNAGVVVVEGLRLAQANSGTLYVLHLLPLAFVGTEAAPARAVLSFLEK